MRRLLPTARSFLIHSGQAASLAAVAVLAMAAAPLTAATDNASAEAPAAPEAPPMTAVAEPAGPVTRLIAFETPVRNYEINSPFGLRRLVMKHAGMGELEEAARASGMRTMYEDGLLKAMQGLTTIEEVLRVTQEA